MSTATFVLVACLFTGNSNCNPTPIAEFKQTPKSQSAITLCKAAGRELGLVDYTSAGPWNNDTGTRNFNRTFKCILTYSE